MPVLSVSPQPGFCQEYTIEMPLKIGASILKVKLPSPFICSRVAFESGRSRKGGKRKRDEKR